MCKNAWFTLVLVVPSRISADELIIPMVTKVKVIITAANAASALLSRGPDHPWEGGVAALMSTGYIL